MARSLILAVCLFSSGCATERGSVSTSEKWGERAKAAHHRVDRFADGVGQVLYPPLFVAAFPLWALAGFGTSAK